MQPPTLDELPPVESEAGAQDAAPLPSDDFAWMTGINVAWEVIALLADLCERIMVGGSLRRGKARVGDVEIILRPRHAAAFKNRCERLLASGRFAFRHNKNGVRIAWGERYRAVLCQGFPVDLFIVQPDRQWGPTCLIRTGGNAANQVLVTSEGRRTTLGDIGVLPPGMKFEDGVVWRGGTPLDTPTERSVFEACRLPWIEPGLRSVDMYQSCAREREWGAEFRQRRVGDPPIPDEYVKFDGRWYLLRVPTLLERRPALAAEVAALRVESEADLVEQVGMF